MVAVINPPPKLTPPPKSSRSPRAEPFRAQLALALAHPKLAPVQPVPGGFALDPAFAHGLFELPAAPGFAGYGLARALRMLLDVLDGLVALHETTTEPATPFAHGDVAPALVRVDATGVARLIPLATFHRVAAGSGVAPERQGYLAPERLLGDTIDRRADVFSCGVLLWEALAGRRLFDSESAEVIVTRLLGGKLELPELPPELAWAAPLKAIAMCALSVDPAQRFEDCLELKTTIEQAAGENVATHEEVRVFFAAREGSLRETADPHAASHQSSLSALVSPLPSPLEPEPDIAIPESMPTASTRALKLWVAAALLTLVATLGYGASYRRRLSPTTPHAALGARSLPLNSSRSTGSPPSAAATTAWRSPSAAPTPQADAAPPASFATSTPLPAASPTRLLADRPAASASARAPFASASAAPAAVFEPGRANAVGRAKALGRADMNAQQAAPSRNSSRPVGPRHEDGDQYGI